MGAMASQPVTRMTEEEYLRIERAATYKSEFVDGEMFAMSGGNPLTVAGEWTPRGLWPLTAWDDDGLAVPL